MSIKNELLEKIEALPKGQKVNVVLSGGGIKGVAHLPFLEYLLDRGLIINSIAGTSAGAVVGAMFASGKTTKEILQFFIDHPLFKYTWIKPGKGGVFNTYKYVSHFQDHVKNSFEELDIPLHICSTNLGTAKAEYFSTGEIMLKLIASCAVPGIYKAIRIGDQLYADGGVMDNYPIHPFIDDSLPIIGNFLRLPSQVESSTLTTTSKVLKRSVYLQRYAIELPKFSQTYLTIQQELNQFSAFKQSDALSIYNYSKDNYFN